MENATKALLIAAGILIVILLIAFGMSVFNATGDTSADAEQVGQQITQQSGAAADATNKIIQGIQLPTAP